MPRKPIEGADERIIQATFVVGGNSPRGSLSTREVAAEAGLSEFTIFSRFKSKEALIEACNQVTYDRFLTANLEAAKKFPNDFEQAFYFVLDLLLANPNMTKFSGNYSLVFPRQDDIDAYAVFLQHFREKWAPMLPFIGAPDKEIGYRVLIFSIREMLQDALYLVSNEVKDTPNNRKTMFTLFSGGLKKFVTIA
jgi:AcrR family transcriptional regulator